MTQDSKAILFGGSAFADNEMSTEERRIENLLDKDALLQSKICIDAEETAFVSSLGRNTVYRLLQAGILPSIRFGSRYVVPVDALREKLNSMVGQEVHL